MDFASKDFAWKNIGPLDNIPRQGARRLCFGHRGRPIAVFRTADDGVFALIDECPHKRGPLSEGIVSRRHRHLSAAQFCDRSHRRRGVGARRRAHRSLPVRIVAGEVHVGIPCMVEAAA